MEQVLKLSEIVPYENNARKNDKAVKDVAESIKQCGYIAPIIVDENNVILAGHTRYKALKKLGYKEITVRKISGLTDQQKRKYRLLDNKTNELADWDFEKLKDEIDGLDFSEFDIDWGLEEDTETISVIEDAPIEIDNTHEPITKLGDIYQLGEHRLMCGDSTNKATVEMLMDGKEADLLLTDPPYNVAYEGKTKDALRIENDKMESDKFRDFLTSAFTAAGSVLKEGGGFYIWFASREHCNFETALNESGLEVRQELIWKKNTMVLGRQDYQWKHEPCLYGWKDGASHNWYSDRCQTTILEFNKPARNGEHPTMKPVELFAYQIQNSTKKGEIVIDLFGGSGTTIIACEQTGRVGYCMELDPKYCDVIIKRWETFTGKKAIKLK